MRKVHRRILSFCQCRQVQVEVYGHQRSLRGGNLQEYRVCQSKFLEYFVTRSDRTGNDDFLAFLNDNAELVKKAFSFGDRA